MLPRHVLLRCLELFFRHFWLNILPFLLMCVAAGLFLLKPIYVSRASIYVQNETLLDTLIKIRIRDQPLDGVKILTPAQVAANEFKELIQTDAFVYAVIAGSDLRGELTGSPDDVRDVLKLYRESFFVEAEGDSLVSFRVEADTPELAYQMANATVNAYRSWKISTEIQDGRIAQSFFEEILNPYEEELASAQAALSQYLAQYPEPAVGQRSAEEMLEIQKLQDQIELATTRLKSVLDKAESARLALAQTERDVDQTYMLMDAPVVPALAEPLAYQAALAMVFPALGLVLTLLIVLGRYIADRTVLSAADVIKEFDLVVCAEIPDRRDRPKRGRGKSVPATPGVDEPAAHPARA